MQRRDGGRKHERELRWGRQLEELEHTSARRHKGAERKRERENEKEAIIIIMTSAVEY